MSVPPEVIGFPSSERDPYNLLVVSSRGDPDEWFDC
jgi:hypothetical protein